MRELGIASTWRRRVHSALGPCRAVRCLDLRHVDLDTETRPVRNGNCTADDLQGLLGQALTVLS